MQTASDQLANLRSNFITEIKTLIGPASEFQDDTALMFMHLVNKDDDYSKYTSTINPHSEIDRYEQAYTDLLSFENRMSQSLVNADLMFEPKSANIQEFILNFILDRNYTIKILKTKRIKKTHWKLSADTGYAYFSYGVATKGEIAISFYLISGEVSEADIISVYHRDVYPRGCSPSYVFLSEVTLYSH
jgi:hypothetical protein